MRLPSGRERTVCDTLNGVVFRTMDSAADAERRENSAGPVVAALLNPPCGVGHDGTFGRYYVLERWRPAKHRRNEARNACRDKDCGDFCGYCASKWRQRASIPAVDKDSSTVRKRLITSS